MQPKLEKTLLIEEAENYLNQLSTERLKLVVDFLAYLQQKEEAKTGKLISFDKIRRLIWSPLDYFP